MRVKIKRAERSVLPVLGVLVIAWGISLLLVKPNGNFPLNDDWLYGRTVQELASTGKLVKPSLAAVSVVFQALWGGGFAALFGFSFSILRLSNLILHLVAVLAVASLVFRFTERKEVAAFAGLTLLVSPLALSSAFSFMPESSLLAMVALTLLALFEWEGSPRTSDSCVSRETKTVGKKSGSRRLSTGFGLFLFSVGAYLVHPVAIILPLWVMVRLLRKGGEKSLGRLWPGLALLGVVPFLFWYMGGSSDGSMTGFWLSQGFALDSPLRLFSRLPSSLIYLGFFLLPVGITGFSPRRAKIPALFFLWTWGQGMWVGGLSPIPLPSLENILTQSGLGFIGIQGSPPEFGTYFWILVSGLSLISILGLLGRFTENFRLPVWIVLLVALFPWAGRFVLGPSLARAAIWGVGGLFVWGVGLWPLIRDRGYGVFAGAWLVLLLALPPFYDRYMVPLLPLFLVVSVTATRKPSRFSWILLVFVSLFSIITVHDYLAWNRARWEVLRDLTAEQDLPPSEIDGGYEWAGWHYSWSGVPRKLPPEDPSLPWWINMWAPQIKPEYIVSLSRIPGTVVEEIRMCPTIDKRWRIFLLRRDSLVTDQADSS